MDKVNGIRVLSRVPARLVPRVCGLQNLERTLSHHSSTHPSRILYSPRRVEEVLRVGHVYSSGRSLLDNVNALIPPMDPFSSRTSSAAAWGALFGDRRNQTRFTPDPNPPLLDGPIYHVDLSKDCGYIRHTNTEPCGTEGTHALGKCNLGLTAKRTGRDEEGWAVASPGVGWGLEAHSLDSGWSLLWALGWPWSILRLSMGFWGRPAPTITGFP